MKYALMLIFVSIFSKLSAQEYSLLDKARIAACLIKGKVGNFVEYRGNALLFDMREARDEWTWNNHLDAANYFIRSYLGLDQIRQHPVAYLRSFAEDSVKFPQVMADTLPVLSDLAAQLEFANMLPYMGSVGWGPSGHTLVLKRIAGFSPLEPAIDYIQLIGLIYHQEFPDKDGGGITICVDSGADPNVKTMTMFFDPQTNWMMIEDDIMAKIHERM